MELMLILRVLLRRWYMILIPVAIAAVFAVPDLLRPPAQIGGGFTTTIRYTAAQVLDAIPERDGDFQDVWLASELTVNAFSEWVRSSSFAVEVSAVLAQNGLEIAPAALQPNISSNNERSIGQVFLSWPDAEQLQAIADAALFVLRERNSVFPQLGGVPAEVTVLDTVQIVPQPPALTSRLGPVIQLAVALLAGVGLAFLVEYLDPYLRRREQLESLRLPVVGTIPKR